MVISVENLKFSHPCIFCAPTEGVPPGIGYWHWWLRN